MGSNDAMRQTWRSIVSVQWLSDDDPTWTALADVMGTTDDAEIDRARSAVKMRWTSGALAQQVSASIGADPPPDATLDDARLRHIGAGYDLPRLGTMTAAQYQAYLDSAWDVHGEGGTVAAITAALHAYGIGAIEIVEEWQDPHGTWGNPGTYGWRICVELSGFAALGWTLQGWPLPLEGSTVFGIAGMAPAQMQDIARLIRRWKIAACLPVRLVFKFGSAAAMGLGGCAFPISLAEVDTAVEFYITGPFLTEDGIPFPIQVGPIYRLEQGQ